MASPPCSLGRTLNFKGGIVSPIVFHFGILAFFYLIVSFQIRSGFPPLYRKFPSLLPNLETFQQAEYQKLVPQFFWMIAFLITFVATELSVFFAGFGAASAWGALRVRSMVRGETTGPLPWLLHPLTVRWPMLLFDLWTLGMVAIFAFMMNEAFA